MRIILPKESLQGRRITISGDNARYLTSVLRCNVGDELEILDGKGGSYKSRIIGIENKNVVADIFEESFINTESPLNLILIQGILKGEKMDMVIQKTTELGIKEIIPAITERSQIRQTRKVQRWRKIAEEAARQSGRSMVPVVREPIELRALLKPTGHGETGTQRNGEMKGFILWEEGGLPLKDAILKISFSQIRPFTDSPIHVLIGPEGGFTKEEIDIASSKGLTITSLGRRILRAETAAISAVTLIQYLLGDI
ncbi:MAG: 16S rRNA (uracil(1498)-N(3))-methyltransferase [Nitrospirae bacterium]|nr:16S rRNA (uracil(1498)-N(3))-methyltransferase [Nitrospirota bacterium]